MILFLCFYFIFHFETLFYKKRNFIIHILLKVFLIEECDSDLKKCL